MCITFVFIIKNNNKVPRPQNKRIVHEPPIFTDFKPIGVKGKNLQKVLLTLDELEAFRLADYKGLSHEESSEEMEISRSVFTRLIEKARKKIAEFIITGKMLKIVGGCIHFRKNIIVCRNCGQMFNIDFKQKITKCPVCHSTNILNLAGGFGHGKCCEEHTKMNN